MTTAIVVSDGNPQDPTIIRSLRQLRIECSESTIISWDTALETVESTACDILVLVAPADHARLIALVALVRQVRAGRAVRILVIGPAEDPKLILNVLHEGADQYVDQNALDRELATALGRLIKEVPSDRTNCRTIAVLAPSGGSGASTIALNIATVLANHPHPTLLMDLNLVAGDLAALLNVEAEHSVADLCQNLNRLDGFIFKQLLVHHATGLDLLPAPRALADRARVTPEGVLQGLRLAKSLYAYIVVDVDHSFGPEQLQVLFESDVVLVVVRLEFTSLRNTNRVLEFLKNAGVDERKIRLVINRHKQPKELSVYEAEEALGRKLNCFVPDDPRTVNQSNNSGVPVVTGWPRSKVAKSLTSLAGSVNGQHSGSTTYRSLFGSRSRPT